MAEATTAGTPSPGRSFLGEGSYQIAQLVFQFVAP